MTRRVVVHIDRLTLAGFAREERHAVAAGLQRELIRVLADPAAVARVRSTGHMAALRVNVEPSSLASSPEAVGASVARAITNEVRR